MNVFFKSFQHNWIVILWFIVFLLFLTFSRAGGDPGSGQLITAVWKYWSGGEWPLMVSALIATLSTAFPVSIAILFISLFFACLTYFKPKISPYVNVFMGLSLLPTVYFIFLIRALAADVPVNVDSKAFLVFVLVFSNLILFFFYMGFRKELYEEFAKEYHSLARLLGVNSILQSSAKKIGLLLMERFKTLFILVFSSTIFAEHKLDVSSGIYSLFYKTATSAEGRPDMFYGQLLFILAFVVVFLVLYDTVTVFIKKKYY